MVLHVGAAESVLLVRVNGLDVGISKDSHLAAEFDVTGVLRTGRNVLRLTVVKYSDASFIEDQDQWWHGGITRSVYLYATGPVHLAGARVRTGLAAGPGGDGMATGTLEVLAEVGSTVPLEPGWNVRIDAEGLDAPLLSPARAAARSTSPARPPAARRSSAPGSPSCSTPARPASTCPSRTARLPPRWSRSGAGWG